MASLHRSALHPITRRAALGGAAATAFAATVPAFAQTPSAQPVREKGPRVWLDLDQEELDDAYDQGKYAPNIRQVVSRYRTNSD